MKNKIIFSFIVFAMLLGLYMGGLFDTQVGQASQSVTVICDTSNDDEATSTVARLTPGNATTTLACNTDRVDQMGLNIFMKASSTATQLTYRVEHSQNNIDWYGAETGIASSAASSSVMLAGNYTEYVWKYSSSTQEASAGNADSAFKHVDIKDIGAAYTRVLFYLPAGSANAELYVEAVTKSQIR